MKLGRHTEELPQLFAKDNQVHQPDKLAPKLEEEATWPCGAGELVSK